MNASVFAVQRLAEGWKVCTLSDDPRLPAVVTAAVIEDLPLAAEAELDRNEFTLNGVRALRGLAD